MEADYYRCFAAILLEETLELHAVQFEDSQLVLSNRRGAQARSV